MDFTPLEKHLETVAGWGVPGTGIVVTRDGKTVYEKYSGFRNHAMTKPVDENTCFALYSMTKLYTSCAAMKLIENGVIGVDDEVSKYLPAYKNLTVETENGIKPVKTPLTVRHLMSMQGGLDYMLASPEINKANEDGHATTRQIVNALASRPLHFEPGTQFRYSLCHDVLAAVIEEASGMKFSDYMHKEIFGRVGAENMVYHRTLIPDQGNISDQWEYEDTENVIKPCEPRNKYELSDNYESGGAGLFASTREYAKLPCTLSCEELSPLKSGTIDLWASDQLYEGEPDSGFLYPLIKAGYSYGLGVRTRTKYTGNSPVGEFGWNGAASAFVLIDRVNRLSLTFTMAVLGWTKNCFNEECLRNALYESVKD